MDSFFEFLKNFNTMEEVKDYIITLDSKIYENNENLNNLKKKFFLLSIDKFLSEKGLSQDFDFMDYQDTEIDIKNLISVNKALEEVKNSILIEMDIEEDDYIPF